MNTHLWASMEADSGGELPDPKSVDFRGVVKAIGYYHMRAIGYSENVARCYWPFAYFRVEMLCPLNYAP